jgi:sulfopyruvate decarboxylase TPP-binding subunit
MVQAAPVAISVPACPILSELERLGITDVVNVPDTHQRTLLAALARQQRIRLLTAATEDEAIAINAGLYIGGRRPMVLIQQTGLLAALNNIKGIALDGRIPTFMLVGYFGRDVTRAARDNTARVMTLIEPTLDAWKIPYFPLETPADLPVIATAYQRAVEVRGPTVVLVGAPTC